MYQTSPPRIVPPRCSDDRDTGLELARVPGFEPAAYRLGGEGDLCPPVVSSMFAGLRVLRTPDLWRPEPPCLGNRCTNVAHDGGLLSITDSDVPHGAPLRSNSSL